MKIAFVGKGGSGKTTLAYRTTEYLLKQGYSVLAIDGDHNMNFAQSLSPSYSGPFLGSAPAGLENLESYITQIRENLKLMVSGPHTEDVLTGKKCSHSLSSPLKKYLPNLILGKKEIVIVDEKAGSDGVGTGILSGFDHIFVISEPTIYGRHVAEQIFKILEYFKIPHSFVLNKVQTEKKLVDQIFADFKKEIFHSFKLSDSFKDIGVSIEKEELEGIEKISKRAGHNSS